MDHSYEEIRSVLLDLLAGREKGPYELNQYQHLLIGVGAVLLRRDNPSLGDVQGSTMPSPADREKFLEVFWGLFREGIITLGLNDANREFPWCRVTDYGRKLLSGNDAYFFHDVSTYEDLIRKGIPKIDSTTLLYLKEAMQAFRSGCILSTTVMLGVATEHTFLLLLETISTRPSAAAVFSGVDSQRTILQKVNKFRNILDQQVKSLPSDIKEDLDTHFSGILSIIRNFRNQAGHPSGTIVSREQAYILLQLFVPYCSKMYQLKDYFASLP